MRLHKHFLPQDLGQASKQYHCFKDCLELMIRHLENGEMEKAKHRSIDVTRSLHELSRLSAKKYEMDKVNQLVEQMGVAGLNIQVIRRFGDAGRDKV